MQRIVITAKLLVDMFAKLDPTVFAGICAIFAQPDDKSTFEQIDYYISESEKLAGAPGASQAIEAMESLRSAYMKMSVFEKEAVRRDIIECAARKLIEKLSGGL